MSMVDPTIQSTPGMSSRQPSGGKPREVIEPSRDSTGDPHGPKQREAESDIAREVLQRIAERARERPPRDIQKLTASAAKFLLINLEPALRLAEELREESLDRPAPAMIEMLGGSRPDRVQAMLTGEQR